MYCKGKNRHTRQHCVQVHGEISKQIKQEIIVMVNQHRLYERINLKMSTKNMKLKVFIINHHRVYGP